MTAKPDVKMEAEDSDRSDQTTAPDLPTQSPTRPRSGGPRTPEGKEASSKNAVKLGIFAKNPVVGDERMEDFEAHLEGVRQSLVPVGYLEKVKVQRIASIQWRRARLEQYVDEIVQCQLDGVDHVSWEDHVDRVILNPSERAWQLAGPEDAAMVFAALAGEEVELEGYEVDAFLLAMILVFDLDPDLRWPGVPEGQAGSDVPWTIAQVQECVEVVARLSGKSAEDVVSKTRDEASYAAARQRFLDRDYEHKRKRRMANALVPPEDKMGQHMRYGAFLDKEEEREVRALEVLQRGRLKQLPAPLRIDVSTE